MKSIRQIISFSLALLLLCSTLVSAVFANGIDTPLFPVPGEDEDELLIGSFYYTLSGTNATVVGYAGWETDISIPATVEYEGTTYTVNAIGEFAFAAENSITSVAISKNVKTVSANAFTGCTKLTDVWYEGTTSNKNGITITSTGNTTFTGATWHYSACITRPGGDKNHAFDNACDTECNYCDATRTVSDHVYDDEKDITCNECGYMRIVPGDVDENNSVTEDDAVHLLFHLYFPDRYQINSYHNPDYNKDETVDVKDVFYLLYHSYFPERFPIELEL